MIGREVLGAQSRGAAQSSANLPWSQIRMGQRKPTNSIILHQVNQSKHPHPTPAMDPPTIYALPSPIVDLAAAAVSPPTSPVAVDAPDWVPHPYLDEDLLQVYSSLRLDQELEEATSA